MAVDLKNFDFGGYATKNGLKCSDGRTIMRDAFKDQDGTKVPLVWQHSHNDPDNVLGHAILENRADGVYAYCKFNDTPSGQKGRVLVSHKDVESLSIYANQLLEKSKVVHGGVIREVSLVLSGANPGALIDYINISHGDEIVTSEDEAVIFTGLPLEITEKVEHADSPKPEDGETVEDVFKSLTEKQKNIVYALLAKAMDAESGDMSQSAINNSNNEGDPETMKKNVFEGKKNADGTEPEDKSRVLTHDQLQEIFNTAQRTGSLREAFLQHAVTYGIENIDYLFPDAQAVTDQPTFVKRDMGWVTVFMNASKHTPFSRIKSLSADITLDTARALGYVKGALKKEEFFALAKRTTGPTTIYKKQKLDRDDILDITDMDVVAWLKYEMRLMLDEEVARACLLGDGRAVESADKIDEACIRPVYKDAVLYTTHKTFLAAATTADIIDGIISSRVDYKGTGNPVLFTTPALLTTMLLLKDSLGRRLYRTQADLEAELRVSKIVEVPVMVGITRVDTTPDPDVTYNLLGVLVNPADYTIGADKGAAIGMFDDFDIDYNQYKYLMETRISGALTNPMTAIVLEQAAA